RLPSGPLPRAGARQGSERGIRRVRNRPPDGRHGVRDPDGDRVSRRRNRDHRARKPATGDPRDARAADCGGARRRRCPAGLRARDNTMRNPQRTASTASALMIVLALVTFVAILGQGIRSSFESAVDQLFTGNYALTSTNTFTPLTVEAEKAVAKAPNVTVVSGVRAGSG